MSRQGWKLCIDGISYPAPQPKNYDRTADPGFNVDPNVSIVFENGEFYQGILDDGWVAVIPDHPGALPSIVIILRPLLKRSAPPQVEKCTDSCSQGSPIYAPNTCRARHGSFNSPRAPTMK
jgi:hypothetical protein